MVAWGAGTEHYLPPSTSSPIHLLELELEHIFQLTGSSRRPAKYTIRLESGCPASKSRVLVLSHITLHTRCSSVGPSPSPSPRTEQHFGWLASHPPSPHRVTVTGRHQRTSCGWLAFLLPEIFRRTWNIAVYCTVENCHFPRSIRPLFGSL